MRAAHANEIKRVQLIKKSCAVFSQLIQAENVKMTFERTAIEIERVTDAVVEGFSVETTVCLWFAHTVIVLFVSATSACHLCGADCRGPFPNWRNCITYRHYSISSHCPQPSKKKKTVAKPTPTTPAAAAAPAATVAPIASPTTPEPAAKVCRHLFSFIVDFL